VLHRAEIERNERLGAEVERLRVDLGRAEDALVAAESGLRGHHSRADAVSSLAEARIEVERAGRRAPWRESEITEASAKLDEADRQIQAGHFGAALFFVYRARRIAQQLDREAERVAESSSARFVAADRVNLRAGPSTAQAVVTVVERGTPVFPEDEEGSWLLVRTSGGPVGWIYAPLLRAR
jgi:hypothetical protein